MGDNMYAHGTQDPTMHIVDMFHVGSPTSVKEHILSQMGCLESHLRLVICTIAFGMGIDCEDSYRSIHLFIFFVAMTFLLTSSEMFLRIKKISITKQCTLIVGCICMV